MALAAVANSGVRNQILPRLAQAFNQADPSQVFRIFNFSFEIQVYIIISTHFQPGPARRPGEG